MKLRLAFFAALALLTSCSKKTDDTPESTANFVITGVRSVDLSTSATGSESFPITVTTTSGPADTVTLYANEIPGGVYVSFKPIMGATPFTSVVTVSTLATQGAGSYTLKINGAGHSGLRSYSMGVSTPAFRGWQLGTDVYTRAGIEKDASVPQIRALAGGGADLILTFAAGNGLPVSNSSYGIAAVAATGKLAITIHDGAHIWKSSGSGGSGAFTFDTQGRFTFKCSNVEMVEGTSKKSLNCSFSE